LTRIKSGELAGLGRSRDGRKSFLDIAGNQPVYCPQARIFMADIANKYPDNVTGKYYVDNQCIDCDLCRETAPNNFTRNDDGGYSFVYKQPGTPEEEAQCKEAMEGCPVEAIGNDGG
jgi:ferredoxin